MSKIDAKIIELEKKYLKESLKECRKCFDMAVTDSCTEQCSKKYIKFMQLKQFFLKGKTSTIEELNTLEKILDSFQTQN